MVESNWTIGLATGFSIGLVTAYFTRRMPLSLISVVRNPSSTNIKLVLVVRNDLGMRKGKIAAQCAHATLGCYRYAEQLCPELLKHWEEAGETKVILRLDEKGEEALVNLTSKAKKAGVVACMIRDAGRTQVARHSATVLGIGPGPAELIDPLVKDLKLFLFYMPSSRHTRRMKTSQNKFDTVNSSKSRNI